MAVVIWNGVSDPIQPFQARSTRVNWSTRVHMDAAPLRDFAVIVDARDNVAVAKTEIPPGLIVSQDSRRVRVTGTITPGNRFATAPIPAGEFVRQYGQPIGTSRGIGEGDPISLANMS